MCNPLEYPKSVREECSCDVVQFVVVVLLDAGGIFLWVRILITNLLTIQAICCIKFNFQILRISLF
jgi:hypothetical protein